MDKNIKYAKWNGEWDAVIDSEEKLEEYLSVTKSIVKEAIDASFDDTVGKMMTNAATNYSDDVLVRRVKGTYNFDCRCSFTVKNGKISYAKAYGTLTGFTWGVRYDETSHSEEIINNGKTVDCFIAGTITNYIIFKGIGDIYSCSVTSGGDVNI